MADLTLINFTQKEYTDVGKATEIPCIAVLKYLIQHHGWKFDNHIEILGANQAKYMFSINWKKIKFIPLDLWKKEDFSWRLSEVPKDVQGHNESDDDNSDDNES